MHTHSHTHTLTHVRSGNFTHTLKLITTHSCSLSERSFTLLNSFSSQSTLAFSRFKTHSFPKDISTRSFTQFFLTRLSSSLNNPHFPHNQPHNFWNHTHSYCPALWSQTYIPSPHFPHNQHNINPHQFNSTNLKLINIFKYQILFSLKLQPPHNPPTHPLTTQNPPAYSSYNNSQPITAATIMFELEVLLLCTRSLSRAIRYFGLRNKINLKGHTVVILNS